MNQGKQSVLTWLLWRFAELALLGGLTYAGVTQELRPLLLFVAGAGGGVYASRLFGWVRANTDIQSWVTVNYHGGWSSPLEVVAGMVGWLFFSPATAALVVAAIGAIFSGAA